MGRPRKIFLSAGIIFTLFLIFNPNFASGEFQFPLKSISPVTTTPGIQLFRVAVEYNQGERLLFQTTDKNRRVTSLPVLDLSFGVSENVELLFEYPFLYLQQDGQESNYGSGDLRIGGVFRVLREGKIFPTCALKLGVKLPNADDIMEFGTDETDFFVGGAFLRNFGKFSFLLNLDFAILGNPLTITTEQDDVLILKVVGIYPLSESILSKLEFDATEFSDFGNNRQFLRGGFAIDLKSLIIDAGGAVGLTEASGDFQAGLGVSMKFGSERGEPRCP